MSRYVRGSTVLVLPVGVCLSKTNKRRVVGNVVGPPVAKANLSGFGFWILVFAGPPAVLYDDDDEKFYVSNNGIEFF